MVRVAVTSYLIFAFAAGQAAFCFLCCTLKACATPVHSSAANTTHSSPLKAPASAGEGGCPSCKTHQKKPSPEKSPSPEKEKHNGCPCKEHGTTLVTQDVFTDHARGWSLEQVFSTYLAFDGPSLLLPHVTSLTPSRATTGLRDGPWLSASDLLTTHHVIRC